MDAFVVKYKFLHYKKPQNVIKQMYGDIFNNIQSNREKYLTFLNRVVADGRVEELNDIMENMNNGNG
jgi:hypothetical protein